MAERLQASVQQTGVIFMFFTLGMLLVGPFYAYLVDAYKRKQVCALSLLVMTAGTLGYDYIESTWQLWALALVQGICFGMATTAGITLAIDLTNSTIRSTGNIAFAWAARLGMVAGIALGAWLWQYHDFHVLLKISAGIGFAGVFFILLIPVPFRAPIGTQLCSCDRFFLPLGWLPALNLILVAFIPGVLLPTLSNASDIIYIQGLSIPFYAIVGVGFAVAAILGCYILRTEKRSKWRIIIGLLLMIASTAQLLMAGENGNLVAALLLGAGIGLVTPEFLLMFVKLSQHCQRGTANTTHLLAWELGISGGIATACWLSAHHPSEVIFQAGLCAGVLALVLFIGTTVPYFCRKRVR